MPSQVPKVLADGRVLAALSVDDSMEFTGALKLFAGEERIGRVPNLAVVKKGRSPDLLIVHCDADWNVAGIQAWNSPGGKRIQTLQQAKAIVERYYTNSASKWVAIT